MMIPPLPTFRQVLAAAIADISEHGYVSPERIADWLVKLRNAAEGELGSQTEVDRETTRKLVATFERLVDRDGILKYVPEVSRYTRAMIRPELRAELDRRILAAVDLIKVDRRNAVQSTLDRFSGWATSIPPGGDVMLDKRETRQAIGKSIARERYQRRLVQNDQGHKLVANTADIVARDNGAIAGIWHDHGEHDKSYKARKEHLERSGKTYLIRGSWADERGLVRAVNGYTDEISAPGMEVNCLPGDTKIPFVDGIEIAYRRLYSGKLTEIITASDKTLRATPNHPVLTPKGWVKIDALKEGDYIIEVAREIIGAVSAESDDNHAQMTIAEIFSAVSEGGVSQMLAGQSQQFHGDGSESEIDIVYAVRALGFGNPSSGNERRFQLSLPESSYFATRIGSVGLFFQSHWSRAARLIGRLSSHAMLLGSFVHGDQFVSGHLVASGATNLFYAVPNHFARNAITLRYLKDAFSSLVSDPHVITIKQSKGRSFSNLSSDINPITVEAPKQAHLGISKHMGDFLNGFPFPTQPVEVVSVKRRVFSGHVYNLQTAPGWYAAGGVITHNCRCWLEYLTSPRRLLDQFLTRRGQEFVAGDGKRAA